MIENTSDSQLSMVQNDTDLIFEHARFEKGTRYYTVILDKDLFDDWVITIANGRIGTKLGRIRKIAFPCFADACAQFHNATKIRIKRGYLLESFRSYNCSTKGINHIPA